MRYTVDDITCLVSDLGLSANFEESLNYKMGGGFYPYLAPEIWRQDSICTTQSDIYAYGLLLWELFSYVEPHTNLEKKDSIYRLTDFKNMVLNGYTPKIPPSADSNWCELIRRCWHSDPNKRPTFSYILRVLEQPRNPLSPNSIEEILGPIDLQISIDKSNDSNNSDSSHPYGGYGYVD
ncbi:hypothetical protein DICPUDRAFT_91361 [Dictyostelium purpureum]|uniref:Protein kinase domain-containing protein n=1 Tax=Dictyostelium purpureum TaxID=5786 RepID=F0ZB66_DICPU|nr:uncharacterized protein DICPUDRAFT_91361 [Dictyostelium purpureum]EGC38838.1 hypothetical protein DICPUDRAFT_91361 [Dictyostelium purpureum]|eukprot:XP_003284632.1 hypothetical protein DICPUDRAFT_91361 [Dictyostelium purpureum]